MKKYSRIFSYLKNYKGKIALYFLLSSFDRFFYRFIGMLIPFFDLIFNGDSTRSQ